MAVKEGINSILVLGLGKVGSLVATLLHETGFTVTGADMNEPVGMPFPIEKLDLKNPGD
jgi:saccharopine dehydrogenase-like NADP-dependent oxidoreductase